MTSTSVKVVTSVTPRWFVHSVQKLSATALTLSLANPFTNTHFLWGSKRTGPDLARLGGRYSDEWHRAHMYNPRDVVPESKMPSYPWLFEDKVDGRDTPNKMKALRMVGVPYTDEDIEGAKEAVDGVTEIEALVAYLQQLGTVITKR